MAGLLLLDSCEVVTAEDVRLAIAAMEMQSVCALPVFAARSYWGHDTPHMCRPRTCGAGHCASVAFGLCNWQAGQMHCG